MIETSQELISVCLLTDCCRFVAARLPRHCPFSMPCNARWFSDLHSDSPLNFFPLDASHRDVLWHSYANDIPALGVSGFFPECRQVMRGFRSSKLNSLPCCNVFNDQVPMIGRSCCMEHLMRGCLFGNCSGRLAVYRLVIVRLAICLRLLCPCDAVSRERVHFRWRWNA